MTDPPRTLYHWTPERNLGSILDVGLLPAFARGKLKVVFACEAKLSTWARLHCALRHDTEPELMTLFLIDTRGRRWVRVNGEGLWCCHEAVPANRLQEARDRAMAARQKGERTGPKKP